MKQILKSALIIATLITLGLGAQVGTVDADTLVIECSGSGSTCTVSGFGAPYDGNYRLDDIYIEKDLVAI